MEQELYHHGILGMKWGVRRYQNKDGTRTAAGKKRYGSNNKSVKATNESVKTTNESRESTKAKTENSLSDAELQKLIDRLTLEKRYSDLVKSLTPPPQKSKAVAFVQDVLEKSGKNLATQLVTYAGGSLINRVAGKDIVNPKKGQKDK